MKKRKLGLIVIFIFIFMNIFSISAAPAPSLSIVNINRLAGVITKIRGKQTILINAANCGTPDKWVARVYSDINNRIEDFALTTYEKNGLPFSSVEEGNAIFGPGWFYYGIYDSANSNVFGYVVAEKINNYPKWEDLSFSGKTNRGVRFEGSYTENNDKDFITNHK